jgi:hypothetical protein
MGAYADILITEKQGQGGDVVYNYSWQGPASAPVRISYECLRGELYQTALMSIPWKLWLIADFPWEEAAAYSRLKPKVGLWIEDQSFPPSELGKGETA